MVVEKPSDLTGTAAPIIQMRRGKDKPRPSTPTQFLNKKIIKH